MCPRLRVSSRFQLADCAVPCVIDDAERSFPPTLLIDAVSSRPLRPVEAIAKWYNRVAWPIGNQRDFFCSIP